MKHPENEGISFARPAVRDSPLKQLQGLIFLSSAGKTIHHLVYNSHKPF
jgi:hypothetical protein